MKCTDEGDAGKAALALDITRTFDAPRALVWRAWTDPQWMSQWSAPHGYEITHSEGEVRPGGAWRSCMRSPDGEDLWLGGRYREVVEEERLVFTHAWDGPEGKPGRETLVTVAFEAIGERTRMTFRQSGFESTDQRDGHDGGWSESFNRLDALLASPK